MKSRILPALLVAGLFVVSPPTVRRRPLFGGNGGCCEPSCCAAEPSCCAAAPSCAAEPTCCAAEPSSGCAPQLLRPEALPPPLLVITAAVARAAARTAAAAPSCAAEPTCCAAAEPSCGCAPSCCASQVLPREALPSSSPLLPSHLLHPGLRAELLAAVKFTAEHRRELRAVSLTVKQTAPRVERVGRLFCASKNSSCLDLLPPAVTVKK